MPVKADIQERLFDSCAQLPYRRNPANGDSPDLSIRNLRPTDKRHCDGLSIFPIDKNGLALRAFPHKADLVVKSDRPSIVGVHVQFDANKPCAKRRF